MVAFELEGGNYLVAARQVTVQECMGQCVCNPPWEEKEGHVRGFPSHFFPEFTFSEAVFAGDFP